MCAVRNWFGDARHEYTQSARRGTISPSGTPGVDWLFRWQGGAETLKRYGLADADHAADDESRRSVCCSQDFRGCHLLDEEVGQRTCVAISSGESELHALTSVLRDSSSRSIWLRDSVSHLWKGP